MKTAYADNAATTQISQEVLDVMHECENQYGNPSSVHSMGRESKELIDNARSQVAKSINAKPSEIIFTSGGTESNNLAIQGFVNANDYMGCHIITTSIEHMSVLNAVEYLQYDGCHVTYLPVDSEGKISLNQLVKSIRNDTILISITFANNEIGTVQPIKEIGDISKRYNICFHTDAVQAFPHCDIDVDDLGIDMLSISGHKFHAPKGVGALYVRSNLELFPILYGSGQEFGLRSGTESVNAIIGMGKAAEILSESDKNETTAYFSKLRSKLIDGIKEKIPGVRLNGSEKSGLCNIANFSFEGVDDETLITMLDSKGIYVSKGSACRSGRLDPSHVLTAIGVPLDLAYGSLRFSFGKYNTENEVDYILDTLPDLVEKARKEAL